MEAIRKKKEKILIEFDVEYNEVQWGGGWIPETIYKYRNWGNSDHRKIIEDIAIWISDSTDFNDPFDCNIPIAYDLLSTDEVVAENFIRHILLKNKNQYGGDFEDEVQKRLKEGKYKNPDFIAKYKKDVHQSMKERSGVFSATPINDNLLMWSHYANSHKGFCLGFNSLKLFGSLGGGGYVNYETNYPVISPIEEYTKQYGLQFLTKSIHWAYELEYRLTTFMKTNTSIPVPPEAISEIIFGANMGQEIRAEIKNLLKIKLPHIKCFSAVIDDNSFKINIIPE